MINTNLRQSRRKKVIIRAVISDREQQDGVNCIIHDGSLSGCKIVSRNVSDLPDDILLNVPSLTQLIKGQIVWRNYSMAGIKFKWQTCHPDDKRHSIRQEMILPAIIMDYNQSKIADCIICDASETGCRITSEALSEFPDDFLIKIPGLTEPVLALIVWQKDNMAGLEFFLEKEVFILDDAQETQPRQSTAIPGTC